MVYPGREFVIARTLLIAVIPATLFSTSITAAIEFALYLLFAASPELRNKLIYVLRNPTSIALLVFLAICAIGVLYGDAPWDDRLGSLKRWRKALVFFLAAAVFDNDKSKNTFLILFVWFCCTMAAISYLTFIWPIGRLEPGIVLRDHAIQGLFFAVGAGVAFFLDPVRWLPAIILLLLTIALGTGRVGYLAFVVIIGTLAFRNSWKTGASIVLACVITLTFSGTVRDRIQTGVSELGTYEQSESLTSMGFRMVMWRNTFSIIKEHWLLGVGTGGFEHAYKQQTSGDDSWRATSTNDPHNQYMRTLSEHGLFGFAAFITFIVLAFLSRHRHQTLLVAILAAWCISSLFASYFSRFVEGEFIFLILGVLLSDSKNTGIISDTKITA